MKKICVVTATRAEYGILEPVIKQLWEDDFFDVRIVATGTHLSEKYGMTYQEIEKDGYVIHRKIEVMPEFEGENDTAQIMAASLEKLASYFEETKPDMLLLLGDRYEAMAFAAAAVIKLIPIAHLHGGEISEGAYDDSFRHCITKMSQLHFPACEEYRKRIIQMGEQPSRVFNVGAPGVENIKKMPLLEKQEFIDSLGWVVDRPFAVVTFHPVTLEERDSRKDLKELQDAMDEVGDMQFIVTKANADDGGRQINEMWLEIAAHHPHKVRVFDNLGQIRYLSAVHYSEFVLGNSSSGIIEVPALQRPTVNIGNREKGRVQAGSIINCDPDKTSILRAISEARSEKMQEYCKTVKSPFDGGNTSEKVKEHIKEYLKIPGRNVQKTFYDIDFDVS